jgi:toxin ParE1/3/4
MPALKLIVRAEAEVDITDAALWCESQREKLGLEFLAEVDQVMDAIRSGPLRFVCLRRSPEVRRATTGRFPYRIFFIRADEAVVVFRVLHSARHDRLWKKSLPE